MELDLTGLQMPNLPEQPREGQVVLRPLERGFGHTLGNTMRRILLSQLRGAAVWAFRTDGVLHEHQTIPGVVEDVHQVIRNLKNLVLKMDEETEEAVLELRASAAGPVTAAAIREHSAVEVVNPDHHILELTEDRELRMELYINKGRGFVLADQHPIVRGMPADLVRIDAINNPVRRANFVVEETRVGQRTDFDRLVVDVETKHSMSPRDAIASAGSTLVELFGLEVGVAESHPRDDAARVGLDLCTQLRDPGLRRGHRKQEHGHHGQECPTDAPPARSYDHACLQIASRGYLRNDDVSGASLGGQSKQAGRCDRVKWCTGLPRHQRDKTPPGRANSGVGHRHGHRRASGLQRELPARPVDLAAAARAAEHRLGARLGEQGPEVVGVAPGGGPLTQRL